MIISTEVAKKYANYLIYKFLKLGLDRIISILLYCTLVAMVTSLLVCFK